MQQQLLTHAQRATNDSLYLLNTIEQKLNDAILTANIDSSEEIFDTPGPRGIINLGGDILTWLFGTAKSSDLERLSQRLQDHDLLNAEIIHSIQEQATTVSENHHRSTLNTKVLGEIRQTLLELDKQFVQVATSQGELLDTMTQLEVVFLHIRRHIEEIQIQVESVALGLTRLSSEHLPPELFSPKKLIHVLQEITKRTSKQDNLERGYLSSAAEVRVLHRSHSKCVFHIIFWGFKYFSISITNNSRSYFGYFI